EASVLRASHLNWALAVLINLGSKSRLEELKFLAKSYYQNTVSLRFFGIEGSIYLALAFCLFALGGYLQIILKLENISIIPMLIAGMMGVLARQQYDLNLVRHLSNQTLLDSDNVNYHKAVYLQTLVAHIGDSLLEAMKNLKEIRETDKSEHGLSTQSEWVRFFKFLYDPESKNRILSLVIYLISLIALITVSKSQTDLIFYELVNQLSYESIQNFIVLGSISIVSAYALLVLPVSFAYKFLVVPLLLKTSSVDALSRFFISELNRYAYLEQRVQRNC
ncbi:hypothetical protein, partial [Vibrio parahaemolyticus]|uniref:hypothetical protein n=1 Tax=Vibrio parahaemolyticus TaxID=670 RepID=UPI001E544279